MKKRIVSIVLLAVLVLSLAFTVSAACDHTYMYITDIRMYVCIDDERCECITYSRETCTKCHDNKDTEISRSDHPHSFGIPVPCHSYGIFSLVGFCIQHCPTF